MNNLGAPHIPEICPVCKLDTSHKSPFCTRCGYDLYYGKKGRGRSACAFCGEIAKMSEEHVFPKWLRKKFSLKFTKTEHMLTRPEQHAFGSQLSMHAGKGASHGQGDPYLKSIRYVCEPCNNGWMSRLQNEAKPLILELAGGRWLDLSENERLILSRWCAMTTIGFEHNNGIITVPEWQRKILMEGGMPVGWKVFTGRMADVSCSGTSFHRPLKLPIWTGPDDRPICAQSTFFCIENVAFYTFSATGNGVLGTIEKIIAATNNEKEDILILEYGLRRVWPDDRFAGFCKSWKINAYILQKIQNRFGNYRLV